MKTHLALILLILSLAGCASYDGPPVPVIGDSEELERLAGEWLGSYQSAETGRSGSIAFHFPERGDVHGDVTMTPPLQVHSASPDLWRTSPIPHTESALRCINIRVLRIRRGTISGDLEPYAEPGSETVVSTSFRGQVDGNRISGTFTIDSPLHQKPQEGTWTVARQTDRR